MTEKREKGWWPGKPGPAPTGKARPTIIPVAVNDEEDEFFKRYCASINIPVSAYLRSQGIPRNWRAILSKLRRMQGPAIP